MADALSGVCARTRRVGGLPPRLAAAGGGLARGLAAGAGGVRSAGCWRNGDRFTAQILSRKRGNLSMADDTRTTIQQRTQHAPDAPHNGSCSQLRVIYDCPAVSSASSVHAGGQRRPFRHAFKSQMRAATAAVAYGGLSGWLPGGAAARWVCGNTPENPS